MTKRTRYLLEGFAVIIVLVISATFMIPEFLNTQRNINSSYRFPDPKFRAFIEFYLQVEPGAVITKEQTAAQTGTMNCSGLGIKSLVLLKD